MIVRSIQLKSSTVRPSSSGWAAICSASAFSFASAGTYVLPFPCLWVDGAWRSIRSDHRIEANVIGWRRQ